MLRFGTSSVQSSPEKYTSSIKACSLICTGVVFVFFAGKRTETVCTGMENTQPECCNEILLLTITAAEHPIPQRSCVAQKDWLVNHVCLESYRQRISVCLSAAVICTPSIGRPVTLPPPWWDRGPLPVAEIMSWGLATDWMGIWWFTLVTSKLCH